MRDREVHPLVHQLVALRHERGLRQQDVADRIYVTRAAIGKFETKGDRDHLLGTLEAYAAAVGAELVMRALPVTCVVEGCCNPEHTARAS